MTTKVAIIAPMFDGPGERWLDDVVRSAAFAFEKILRRGPKTSWHQRGEVTPLAEWTEFFGYARRAFAARPDVIVTIFPQLAFAAGLWKTLTLSRTPVIAWAFNLGSTQNRLKGRIAGLFLRSVNLFVVHSTEERARYADWLRISEDQFRFAPLQKGPPRADRSEEADSPYLLSMGSAGRDYETLIRATEDFDGRMIIVTKDEIAAALPRRDNIDYRSGLTLDECEALLAGARLNVVPIANQDTASGQVTFLMSMALGVATIATDCPGTRDYLRHGEDALVTPPGDAAALGEAIGALWRDASKRKEIADNGKAVWSRRFSDEAAAAAFVDALEGVSRKPRSSVREAQLST